jgi:glutamate/tyrosine decarboxylase-like PLP-dependent enzyme
MGYLDPSQPGWVWTPDDLHRWAQTAGKLVADALLDGAADPAVRRPPTELVRHWENEPWNEAGADPDDLWQEMRATITAYPFGNAHPRFSAWVNSPPHPLAAMAAGVAAALNPSVAGGNHAAVHVEHMVVRWFRELVGLPASSGGQMVSGASAAALTALAVARYRATVRLGHHVRRQGMAALAATPLMYATAEAHSCHIKAVEALGIGSDHLVVIPTDADRRMIPDALRQRLVDDRAVGALPVAVIASAGTVNTGAVDPLAEIAKVCAEHDVWLHVDAAYGGPAVLLLDRWASERAAMVHVDSVAIDAHKWLYIPVDAGVVLFRDADAARETFSLVPDYLRTGGDPAEPVWFSEYGLEQTRPMRALKVWITLKHLGWNRLRELIARDIAVAESLRDAVHNAADFELLGHGLSVVCFRHRPPGLAADALDRHNKDLLRKLTARGSAFIAGTRIDNAFGLRACIVNPGTTTTHTTALLDDIRAAAAPQHRQHADRHPK